MFYHDLKVLSKNLASLSEFAKFKLRPSLKIREPNLLMHYFQFVIASDQLRANTDSRSQVAGTSSPRSHLVAMASMVVSTE